MSFNRENLQLVRDTIASAPPSSFYMGVYFSDTYVPDGGGGGTVHTHPCGTAACIAGWAAALSCGFVTKGKLDVPPPAIDHIAHDAMDLGADFLGLATNNPTYETDSDAGFMFFGLWAEGDIVSITREEALRYLDLVLKTGNVRCMENGKIVGGVA